jgi:hypothetical protein
MASAGAPGWPRINNRNGSVCQPRGFSRGRFSSGLNRPTVGPSPTRRKVCDKARHFGSVAACRLRRKRNCWISQQKDLRRSGVRGEHKAFNLSKRTGRARFHEKQDCREQARRLGSTRKVDAETANDEIPLAGGGHSVQSHRSKWCDPGWRFAGQLFSTGLCHEGKLR